MVDSNLFDTCAGGAFYLEYSVNFGRFCDKRFLLCIQQDEYNSLSGQICTTSARCSRTQALYASNTCCRHCSLLFVIYWLCWLSTHSEWVVWWYWRLFWLIQLFHHSTWHPWFGWYTLALAHVHVRHMFGAFVELELYKDNFHRLGTCNINTFSIT